MTTSSAPTRAASNRAKKGSRPTRPSANVGAGAPRPAQSDERRPPRKRPTLRQYPPSATPGNISCGEPAFGPGSNAQTAPSPAGSAVPRRSRQTALAAAQEALRTLEGTPGHASCGGFERDPKTDSGPRGRATPQTPPAQAAKALPFAKSGRSILGTNRPSHGSRLQRAPRYGGFAPDRNLSPDGMGLGPRRLSPSISITLLPSKHDAKIHIVKRRDENHSRRP